MATVDGENKQQICAENELFNLQNECLLMESGREALSYSLYKKMKGLFRSVDFIPDDYSRNRLNVSLTY